MHHEHKSKTKSPTVQQRHWLLIRCRRLLAAFTLATLATLATSLATHATLVHRPHVPDRIPTSVSITVSKVHPSHTIDAATDSREIGRLTDLTKTENCATLQRLHISFFFCVRSRPDRQLKLCFRNHVTNLHRNANKRPRPAQHGMPSHSKQRAVPAASVLPIQI